MIKSSVIIVENSKGDVFIVENKEEKPQIDKILNSSIDSKIHQNQSYVSEEQTVEEEEIIEEYLDEYFEEIKSESVFNVYGDHQYTNIIEEEEVASEENYDDTQNFEDVFESNTKQNMLNSKKQYHKFHQLTGKAACKFCETVFKSKESLKQHCCKYLQCDPKNFICRICNKELSKKTFSNHLHEGVLDCQYCAKAFVNPRNLKTHIKKIHKNEKFIPPNSPNRSFFNELKIEEGDNAEMSLLDDQTGLITSKPLVEKDHTKKKSAKKAGSRFECDLCGRIFSFARSLTTHLLLHTKDYRYVCETCGEKFTTKTGITKHSCCRKRKRPSKDFRTVDVRHCKYCDLWFSSLEENRSHACKFQPSHDPKIFVCRFCMMEMSKNSFNKHMSRHLNPKEYVCKLCDKKLACEKALVTHLTVHSGIKPFHCNHCEKSFINKTLLIRHSRFHGIDIPQYKCSICEKIMASKYHLKTHTLQLHSEFQICQICKQNFSTREKLKEHYQTNHEKYSCSYCSKSFVLPRYLKMHEKLHTGETTRRYNCIYCLKQFSKRALANHVFSQHQEFFNEWRDKNMEFIMS